MIFNISFYETNIRDLALFPDNHCIPTKMIRKFTYYGVFVVNLFYENVVE